MAEITAGSWFICIFNFAGGGNFVSFSLLFADGASFGAGLWAGVYDLQRHKTEILAK